MILSEFYTALSVGPLSNLSIANDGNGSIKDSGKSKITFHLNNVLTKVYTRFILSETEIVITVISGQDTYDLGSECIKPMKVYTQCGDELPINDENSNCSVYTPRPQVIQLPISKMTTAGKKVSVIFQNKHLKIDANNADAPIIVPTVLEEAVIAYVASKVYSDMAGQENLVKSQELLAEYESVCKDIEENDLVSNSISTTIIRGFERKGWI